MLLERNLTAPFFKLCHFLLGFQSWSGSIFFIVLGLLAGLIVEKVLLGTIRKVLNRTPLALNQQMTGMLQGLILWLFGLWGVYMATYTLPTVNEGWMILMRKGLLILGMLVVLRLVARSATLLVRFYLSHSKGFETFPNTSIFENLIRIGIFVVGFLMVLQTVGVSVVPILTALGVGGLAVSLALQDTLANLFAGLQMILASQIKVGDYVQLNGNFEGFIDDIGWRNTIIRQRSNNRVIVPNHTMASSILTNYTSPMPEMSVPIEVRLDYQNDLERVEALAIAVAKEVQSRIEKALPHFEPYIRYQRFEENGILFTVFLRVCHPDDQFLLRHEMMKALHARFHQEGIQVGYHQTLMQADGGTVHV